MNLQSFSPNYDAPRASVDSAFTQFLAKTYAWMAGGLSLSGVVAYAIANMPAVQHAIFGNSFVLLLAIVAQLVLVGVFTAKAATLSSERAGALFLSYSALNGLTLAGAALVYTQAALTQAFVITALSFGALAVYGTVTKRNLAPMTQFLTMGLVGVTLAMVVNIFVRSSGLDFVVSCAGALLFAGMTAYDHHRLRRMYDMTGGQGNLAINGALMLYLDFINLFMFILRLSDNRRR